MSNSTLLYPQLMRYLRQHSQYRDLRHLKALAWMVSALIASGQLSLCAWEPYVSSFAQLAQSTERRWQRFMHNARIQVEALYLPLLMAALSGWQSHRLYLALDTTVLWDRALHDSPLYRLLWTRREESCGGCWSITAPQSDSMSTESCSAKLGGYCAIILM